MSHGLTEWSKSLASGVPAPNKRAAPKAARTPSWLSPCRKLILASLALQDPSKTSHIARKPLPIRIRVDGDIVILLALTSASKRSTHRAHERSHAGHHRVHADEFGQKGAANIFP